jgi:hypothetical protein
MIAEELSSGTIPPNVVQRNIYLFNIDSPWWVYLAFFCAQKYSSIKKEEENL